jgi:hypothetical protein
VLEVDRHAKPHTARKFMTADVCHRLAVKRKDALGVSHHCQSSLVEHHRAALTVEESGGYEFFKFLHLQADRGLRPTHTGGGSSQSAGLAHGDERLQQREVENLSTSASGTSWSSSLREGRLTKLYCD